MFTYVCTCIGCVRVFFHDQTISLEVKYITLHKTWIGEYILVLYLLPKTEREERSDLSSSIAGNMYWR